MKCFICGISGKMGKELLSLSCSDTEIVGGLDSKNYYDSSLVPVSIIPDFDIIIDFSDKSALDKILKLATEHNVPLVTATTGFDSDDENRIIEASKKIPILKISNTSYGINVVNKAAALMASLLEDWDCSIIEKHHKSKKDTPSGTALMIKQTIQNDCNKDISIASIRGGTLCGEHKIVFLGQDEEIILTHIAYSRKIFALGALKAAKKLIDKPAGLYTTI